MFKILINYIQVNFSDTYVYLYVTNEKDFVTVTEWNYWKCTVSFKVAASVICEISNIMEIINIKYSIKVVEVCRLMSNDRWMPIRVNSIPCL